ncbi:MAG: trypsin-like peptidase domain-containing protein, partial [Oscillospiraceae bacterium]
FNGLMQENYVKNHVEDFGIQPPKIEEKDKENLPQNDIKPYVGKKPNVVINTTPDSDELSTENIVDTVAPCVVGIMTEDSQGEGLGSGIIISDDGFIVTNAHVVNGSKKVEVLMLDETLFTARLIGIDVRTDLAVIKVDGKNLPFVQFGNSDELKVGSRAIAIGNPGGFSNTVTQGIISAKNRQLTIPVTNEQSYTLTLLQTDASINPGNSGGALVNKYGQVIGINSAKISADSFEGIGFAIPTNIAKPIIDELILNGKVRNRAVLGITVVAVESDESDESKEKNIPKQGLYILEITDECPLNKKNIKVGDIIVAVNGDEAVEVETLTDKIKASKPGDELTLEIYSSESEKNVIVTIKLLEG